MNQILKILQAVPSKLAFLHTYRKAIVSGGVAFFFSILQLHSHGLTSDDWIQITVQTLTAAGLVWAIPNKKA